MSYTDQQSGLSKTKVAILVVLLAVFAVGGYTIATQKPTPVPAPAPAALSAVAPSAAPSPSLPASKVAPAKPAASKQKK